jgi:hypothetical protein
LEAERIFQAHIPRNVEIEYVFQPDGSRDFTRGNLQPRIVTLNKGNDAWGLNFATGVYGTGGWDINHREHNGNLGFNHTYGEKMDNGFYDAGKVPFESVEEASDKPGVYRSTQRPFPVNLNHVYVVKTTEGKYAKFIVHKIIRMTVLPPGE